MLSRSAWSRCQCQCQVPPSQNSSIISSSDLVPGLSQVSRYIYISTQWHPPSISSAAVSQPLVTCHAGADADSARDIMNLSSGSCLNAPLAPALLFQCWYLQLRDGGNLKLQLFWSVHSGWPGLAAAVCRLGLDIYDPRPVRGTLTMRPPSQLWPAQHGGLQSRHRCTLICTLFISRLVCREHLLARNHTPAISTFTIEEFIQILL